MRKQLALSNKIPKILDLIKAYDHVRPQGEGRITGADLLTAASPPERMALRNYVDALPDKEKRELAALMLLGRGDFDDFKESLVHCETYPIEHTTGYVMGKSSRLERYLLDGIAKL